MSRAESRVCCRRTEILKISAGTNGVTKIETLPPRMIRLYDLAMQYSFSVSLFYIFSEQRRQTSQARNEL